MEKVQLSSMYGKKGTTILTVPRFHGRSVIEKIIKEGCIKQSYAEVKK